jgi:uncharacterized 2Fe-2S/4Fe-4S cluster protein (DUF4445 family)
VGVMTQQYFVEAMAIPHKTAPFTELRKVVDLLAVKVVETPGDVGGARRMRKRE